MLHFPRMDISFSSHSAAAQRKKRGAAAMSIAVTGTLTVLKLVVGVLTSSLAVISEALHSLLDVIAASIAYFSIKKSGQPADDVHHYGHAKFEPFGAFLEGLLIFVPYMFVLYYAIKTLTTAEVREEYLGWAIILMAVSIVANFAAAHRLDKVAKETHSIALRGDSLHLFSDGITSAAILLALVLIKVTGLHILDPIFAIAVSVYIIYVSFILLRRSSAQLLDAAPKEEAEILTRIREMLRDFPEDIVGVHDFRIRGHKPSYFLDFHLVACRHLTLQQGHDLCDKLEESIRKEYPGCDITIHLEPCGVDGCPDAHVIRGACVLREEGGHKHGD